MKKFSSRVFILAILITLFASPQYLTGWNDTGHKVIGAIAWDNLTETTKQKVMEIMMNAPDDSDMLDLYDEKDQEAAKFYFMKANSWSDVVRDRDERARWQKYHKGSWHYIGTYWKQTNNGPEDATGLLEDENIVERIEYFRSTLSTEEQSDFDEAIEIAWVLHLVGDIHMPLHNTSRVTEKTPDGDRGGNSFRLGDGWPWNLHSFWDGIINIAEPMPEGLDEYKYLIGKADQIMKLHPRDSFNDADKIQDAEIWNQEGQDIVRQSVYPSNLKQNEKPDMQYTENAYKIAQQRMALSGYRMAEFLNSIFDPS